MMRNMRRVFLSNALLNEITILHSNQIARKFKSLKEIDAVIGPMAS